MVFTGNSCVVYKSGKSETWPATARGLKAPRWRRSRKQSRRNGIMTRRMAFSWTCQPKRKEEKAVRVRAPRKVEAVGLRKSLIKAGYLVRVG
jgi:hypothetical protein